MGDMAHIGGRALELHVDTFSRDLQLAALGDLDCCGRLVARESLGVLDLLHDVVALEDLAEDDVTAIEPPNTGCVSESCPNCFYLFPRWRLTR